MDTTTRQRIIRDRRWSEAGSCRQQYPEELFFSERGENHLVARARRICLDCPVRAECLRWIMAFEAGMGHTLRFGVWAGFTGTERWLLDKAAPPAAVVGAA